MDDFLRAAFQTLEVSEHASQAEARDAYRTLVAVWHPDRFMNQPHLRARADQKIKEINEAFALLTAHFQRERSSGLAAPPAANQSPSSIPNPPSPPHSSCRSGIRQGGARDRAGRARAATAVGLMCLLSLVLIGIAVLAVGHYLPQPSESPSSRNTVPESPPVGPPGRAVPKAIPTDADRMGSGRPRPLSVQERVTAALAQGGISARVAGCSMTTATPARTSYSCQALIRNDIETTVDVQFDVNRDGSTGWRIPSMLDTREIRPGILAWLNEEGYPEVSTLSCGSRYKVRFEGRTFGCVASGVGVPDVAVMIELDRSGARWRLR